MIKIKQAVILAAGLGIRLRPLTYKVPKPMVIVNDKPFLQHLITLLKKNGIKEVIILAGYKHKKIMDYFKDGSNFGIKIKYIKKDDVYITGDLLKMAGNILSDHFLLLYCDNYWPLNLNNLVNYYHKQKKLVSVTVFTNKNSLTKNNILVKKNGLVAKYDSERKDKNLNGVEIGFFIVNKKVLDLLSSNFKFEKEIFSLLIPKKQISGFLTKDRYYSAGNLEKLKETEIFFRSKKAIFLDRDGVINKKKSIGEYVKNWKEFEFLPGSRAALKLLSVKGYDIFIITNQAGIGRGLITEKDLEKIHIKLKKELNKDKIKIKAIYYCPHVWNKDCECRKPKPGMLLKAAKDYDLDLTKTIFVGDDERDLKAGKAVGCKTIILKTNETLLDIVKPLTEEFSLN